MVYSANSLLHAVCLLLTYVLKATVSVTSTVTDTTVVYSPSSLLYAVCFLLTYMLKTVSNVPNDA